MRVGATREGRSSWGSSVLEVWEEERFKLSVVVESPWMFHLRSGAIQAPHCFILPLSVSHQHPPIPLPTHTHMHHLSSQVTFPQGKRRRLSVDSDQSRASSTAAQTTTPSSGQKVAMTTAAPTPAAQPSDIVVEEWKLEAKPATNNVAGMT